MKSVRIVLGRAAMAAAIFALVVNVVSGQTRNDREIRDAVRSLNSKLEDFESNIRFQMQSSSASTNLLSEVSGDIRELRNSIRQFQDLYDVRRENRDDVRSVTNAARRINDFVRSYPQNRRVEDDWTAVIRQIDRLAGNYSLRPEWNNAPATLSTDPNPMPPLARTMTAGLSGTYDVDTARSESVEEILNDAKVQPQHRSDLTDKLTAPAQIALDVRGNQIILATSNSAPVTFIADGREKSEQNAAGKTIRLKATLSGNTLTVATLGGDTDYTIVLTSESDGKVLKVTRRITTEYLDHTIFAESIYNKTDSVAGLGIKPGSTADPAGTYSDNDSSVGVSNGSTGYPPARSGAPVAVTSKPGNYTVPNGVVITGILENELNTKISQNNDRFRMTVQSPDEFRGAIVEGYVSGISRSGAVTGDPKLTLNFEKITLRSGETFDFAGNIQSAQPVNGKKVTVDNEGTLKGESQTKETATRGGIGAGIGAIIGAIAGGAKGAAIGAVIGGGGGAGSVAIQGKNDIQLQQGSTITVVSSSPMR